MITTAVLSLGGLALAAPRPASATTYVAVADEALVDQAPLIVVGRALSHRPHPGASPAVEYVFAVERAVKGAPGGEQLTVRVLGGVGPEGLALKIWGAPVFRDGERALLFLEPRGDGAYRVLHLTLGAFHVVSVRGRSAVVRDLSALSEARAVRGGVESAPAGPDRPRDLARFARWAADRAAGRRRAADYFLALPEPELRRLTAPFSLFEFNGLNMRWFQFATGGSITFRAHQDGQDGLAGGGFAEFQTALAAWNADAATTIDYTYGGTTTAAGGFITPDGVNTILFNDPNDEIGSFSCASGGVLAIGGPWFDPSSTGVFNGLTYIRIVQADIITNDGIACFFAGSPDAGKAAEELFAHELGHTLGLNHSAESEALMHAFIHDDGRGASLHPDDRAGIHALYGSTTLSFFTLTPCRLLDTRDPADLTGGSPILSGQTLSIPASGKCGIPAMARALSVNVTAVGATSAGHITLFPQGLTPPATSTVNFGPGQTRANNAVVVLAPGSPSTFRAAAFVLGAGSVHLIVDVNGYFQ
jgi:hypothetical protein